MTEKAVYGKMLLFDPAVNNRREAAAGSGRRKG